MQVTCLNCRARYAVDPLAIGLRGRTVQCARCAHRWFETVPAPALVEAVPDFVMRPSDRTPSLPALIEHKVDGPWTKVLVGVVVAVILLAAGVFALRNQIATRLPLE